MQKKDTNNINNCNEKFIPFAKPEIDEATIAEVVECLRSGWLATGPRVKKFTEEIKSYLGLEGERGVVPLTSATAGLFLALKCMDIGDGDEVITTPMTFVASLNTIVHTGARPVLADIDRATYNIDISKIEAAITSKTKAIMPVHFCGTPVNLDDLYKLATKHNLRIIEDSAQAIGSIYKGIKIGSFGDTQVFSFHPNKAMTTGEGGCIVTNDQELLRKAQMLSFHGIDRSIWNRTAKGGSQHYDVMDAGYKFNMMDLQAAIGIHQIRNLEKFIEKRTILAKRYHELLKNRKEITLPYLPQADQTNCDTAAHDASNNDRSCICMYAPLLNLENVQFNRDEFISMMGEENIGLCYHYQAAHLFSYYNKLCRYKRGDFPNAEYVSDRIFSVPLFPGMTFDDQDRVVEAMIKIFNAPPVSAKKQKWKK